MPLGPPESDSESSTEGSKGNRRGRPSKQQIAAHKPGGRKQVGRPKGDTAIMADYKARMLASPKSRKVIQKVFDTALEDGHPHQAACMKMVMDRIAPISSFAEQKAGGTPQIKFIFNMEGNVNVQGQEEAIDAEFEPVDSDSNFDSLGDDDG